MKLHSFFLITIFALAFSMIWAVSPATAGSMGNGAAQRQKLVIDSVDPLSGTVVFKSGVDQSIHTYKIDAGTRITIQGLGAKGTIDQLKVGQKVGNYIVGNDQPPQLLKTLLVSKGTVPAPTTPASQ